MKTSPLALALALATALTSTPVRAQDAPTLVVPTQAAPMQAAPTHAAPAPAARTEREVAASAAPLLAQQAVGARRMNEAPVPPTLPAPFRADTRQNRALMIVGGAGMLAGAVIGGDAGTLISVGGAVVFLWGLYQYVN